METGTASEPVLTLTESAAEEVRALLKRSENTGKTLRVFVEKGGCSGMQYSLVFDEKRDGDSVSEGRGINVLVDAFSVEYLRGAVVDFSHDLTSGGFKITNPNAKQSCGCGKSFET